MMQNDKKVAGADNTSARTKLIAKLNALTEYAREQKNQYNNVADYAALLMSKNIFASDEALNSIKAVEWGATELVARCGSLSQATESMLRELNISTASTSESCMCLDLLMKKHNEVVDYKYKAIIDICAPWLTNFALWDALSGPSDLSPRANYACSAINGFCRKSIALSFLESYIEFSCKPSAGLSAVSSPKEVTLRDLIQSVLNEKENAEHEAKRWLAISDKDTIACLPSDACVMVEALVSAKFTLTLAVEGLVEAYGELYAAATKAHSTLLAAGDQMSHDVLLAVYEVIEKKNASAGCPYRSGISRFVKTNDETGVYEIDSDVVRGVINSNDEGALRYIKRAYDAERKKASASSQISESNAAEAHPKISPQSSSCIIS